MVERTVTHVVDGDTFDVDIPVNGSRFIRMTGRDTPFTTFSGYAFITY